MYTRRQELPTTKDLLAKIAKNNHVVFFDIETTGFSPKTTTIYLIGCIYFQNNMLHEIQWVAENKLDEPSLLHAFFSFLESYKTIIHFNGLGFDLPYIEKKCQHYQLPYNFNTLHSIDLYKVIYPYKKHLKLDNLKQKTLEQFLEIKRDDIYSGRELISIYMQYQENPTNELLSVLLLHNHDDLLGMVQLLPLLSYHSLFQGNIVDCTCETHSYINKNREQEFEVIFSFTCTTPLPKKISYAKNNSYLTCMDTSGKLCCKIYTGELKYFFPNYKDYYYLPLEDVSIHKSVSFYVDSNFRTKAKAANCYSKKTGRFLRQEDAIITPYFKQDYSDKLSYFELTEDFLQDSKQQLLYVKHMLASL